MKLPELILFKIKNDTVAFLPRYFRFTKTEFDINVPVYIPKDGEIDFIIEDEETYDLNKNIEEEYNNKMHTFSPSKLEEIYINTTNVCAGKCTYCYAEDVMVNSDVVTFDDFMKVVEKYDSVDTLKSVNLLGGEPLLNFKLIERLLKETDLIVSISTGLFISDKIFERFMTLAQDNIDRISVQCSIDPTNKYRPGKNGGEAIYRRTYEILKNLKYTSIRPTLCTGDYNYRKLRNDYEKKLGKEVSVSFEIVSKRELWPTMEEWYDILGMLLTDSQEYLQGERTTVPLYCHEVAENLCEQWDAGHENFFVSVGCSMYSGDIPVLTPDTIKNMEFQRCTQPQEPDAAKTPQTMNPKCASCSILRYCGASCPQESAQTGFCATQLLKHIVTIYIFLRSRKVWN